MSQTFKIRKGYDIKLVGEASSNDLGQHSASTYAVSPLDFPGITPKLAVKAGAKYWRVILCFSTKTVQK
jgi:Na+-transporting NADH:ubiquinone oxidoreductase subunit A